MERSCFNHSDGRILTQGSSLFLFALGAACNGSLDDPDERMVGPETPVRILLGLGGLLQSLKTASKPAHVKLTNRCTPSLQGLLGVHVLSRVKISVKPNL